MKEVNQKLRKHSKMLILLLALIMLFMSVIPPIQVMADEGGFYFKRHYVEMVVHEDATVSVTVELDVYYEEERHGIYFYLPEDVEITRIDERGNSKVYYYRPKISDVYVEGDDYEVDDNEIIIGHEDRLVEGDKSYTIHYTYDFGDDRVTDYDELYYSFIGSGWNCYTEEAAFSIMFDKDCELDNIHLYAGAEGEKGESRVEYVINGNMVLGYVEGGLEPNEAVTVFLRLPEGYYEGERASSPAFMQIMLVVSAGLAVLAVIRMIYINFIKGAAKVVKVRTFYPPEDMTSAEVGYVIDYSADDKDFMSLLIWFACKGYIKLYEDEDGGLHIEKLKAAEDNWPAYLKRMYRAFLNNPDFDADIEHGEAMHKALMNSRVKLEEVFKGRRTIKSAVVSGFNYLIQLAACGGIIAGVIATAYNGKLDALVIAGMFVGLAYFIIGIVSGIMLQNTQLMSEGKKVALIVLWGLVVVIGGLVCSIFTTYDMYIWIYMLCGAVSVLAAGYTNCSTVYRRQLMGKLLGFRDYIMSCELEKLSSLVNDNPGYFYDVLPYAYVFGLTDEWILRFETVDVEPIEGFGMYGDIMTMHMLHHVMHQCNHSVDSIKQGIESYNASVSSDSSGGSSGGGFGGGGGGSW